MLMANTHTTLADCTTRVSSAAIAKARSSESPAPSSMPANQGSCASGAAASLRSTRPRRSIAPPNSDHAIARNRDSRSLATTAPATPSTNSATNLMSKVTTRTRRVTPMHPPRMSARAPRVVMRPERRIPTTMNVSAVMLWKTHPATVPHARADHRLPVHRAAALRRRRLAMADRCSVSSRIPTMNRPSPPAIPAKSSIMRPPIPGLRRHCEARCTQWVQRRERRSDRSACRAPAHASPTLRRDVVQPARRAMGESRQQAHGGGHADRYGRS